MALFLHLSAVYFLISALLPSLLLRLAFVLSLADAHVRSDGLLSAGNICFDWRSVAVEQMVIHPFHHFHDVSGFLVSDPSD